MKTGFTPIRLQDYVELHLRANPDAKRAEVIARLEDAIDAEPHHTMRLADDGPDHPARVIGLCPTCHRRAHHAQDANVFNSKLKKRVIAIEAKRAT